MFDIHSWAKSESEALNATVQSDRAAHLARIENNKLYDLFREDRDYAQTERGEEVSFTAIYEDYIRAILDLRIPTVVCGGCAQSGKSLSGILTYSWITTKLGFNSLFIFPQLTSLQRLIPQNHKPLIRNWESRFHPKTDTSQHTDNTQSFASRSGGTMMFSYSGAKAASNEGAAASVSIVSVSTDVLFVDEVSQYAPGAVDAAFRRLDAGRIPTKPVRLFGTCGSGAGIEQWLAKVERSYYPAVDCPHCKECVFLDPFGVLLKPVKQKLPSGEVMEVYLSSAGRPLDWHYHDEKDKVGSAYYGCPYCSGELDDTVILAARMRNRTTHNLLVDELNESVPQSCSVELSPVSRGKKSLYRLLHTGLTTANSPDWVQQGLGKPSTFDATVITREQIERAFGRELPYVAANEYDIGLSRVTILGIDQGRAADATVIVNYYFDRSLPNEGLIAENAVRELIYEGMCNRSDLPALAETYGVIAGMIDSEPSVDSAASVAREIGGLELGDQQARQKDDFIIKEIRDGGNTYSCVKLAYRKIGRQLILGFSRTDAQGLPLYRLHDDLAYVMHDVTENSLVRHLTSVSFNPDTSEIERPADHCDHKWFALMFAEAAFRRYLQHGGIVQGKQYAWESWM